MHGTFSTLNEQANRSKMRVKYLAILSFIICLVNTMSLRVRLIENRFECHPFHYLNVTHLEARSVDDHMDCSFACLQNALCVSFNVAVLPDNRRWCELLPFTSYNETEKLTGHHQSRHYSIQVSNTFIPYGTNFSQLIQLMLLLRGAC